MNLYRGVIEYYAGNSIEWDFEAEKDSIAQAIVDEKAQDSIGVERKRLY